MKHTVLLFVGMWLAFSHQALALREFEAEENLSYVMPAPPVFGALKGQLAEALEDQGIGKNLEVHIIGKEEDIAASLHNGAVENMVAEPFDVDRRTGQFSALVRFTPYGGTEESYARIKAKYVEMVRIPVLKNRVSRGKTIRASNITWVKLPHVRVKHDTVRDKAALVGKAPLRTLAPGKPIRERILTLPALVHKNDRVRMTYQTKYVKIMAFGMALDEGGKGTYIPVKNLTSGRVVNALVEAKNQVVIPSDSTINYKVAANGHP